MMKDNDLKNKKRISGTIELVTFQSFEALKSLINKGYLECNEKYIDLNKSAYPYSWVIEKMNKQISNQYNTKYPIWCWVKCYKSICPSKHKGAPIKGFDVKITFKKEEKEVFITDFIRYSFLLNNMYIPDSLKDKEAFDKLLKEKNITREELIAYVRRDKYASYRTDKEFLDICEKIRNSFDKCITSDSDILQGCVWRISLSEIEKIEILNDPHNIYGSLNYVRSNGKRKNWIEEYYKLLK